MSEFNEIHFTQIFWHLWCPYAYPLGVGLHVSKTAQVSLWIKKIPKNWELLFTTEAHVAVSFPKIGLLF